MSEITVNTGIGTQTMEKKLARSLYKQLSASFKQGQDEYDDLKARFDEEKAKTKKLRAEVKKLKKEIRRMKDRNSALNKYSRFDVMEMEE